MNHSRYFKNLVHSPNNSLSIIMIDKIEEKNENANQINLDENSNNTLKWVYVNLN